MADMHIDGSIVGSCLPIVEALHQSISRDNAPRIAHELFQDVEFKRRNLYWFAVADHFASAGIQQDAVYFHAATVLLVFGPAQYGLDARSQLARVERLRQIVVGAELQSDDSIHVLSARRQHKHWNPAG